MTTETGATRTRRRHFAAAIVVATAVCLLDIATKVWATQQLARYPVSWFGGAVRFTESRNPGAAFGVGGSLTPFITVVALVAVVALLVITWRTTSLAVSLTLGLILGGTLGNLVDRLARDPGPFRGQVVDWIDIGSWPTFNLADSGLVVGGIVMVLLLSRQPS